MNVKSTLHFTVTTTTTNKSAKLDQVYNTYNSYLEAPFQVGWTIVLDPADDDVTVLVLDKTQAESPTLMADVQSNLGETY